MPAEARARREIAAEALDETVLARATVDALPDEQTVRRRGASLVVRSESTSEKVVRSRRDSDVIVIVCKARSRSFE